LARGKGIATGVKPTERDDIEVIELLVLHAVLKKQIARL
jgi:hypothetical protein